MKRNRAAGSGGYTLIEAAIAMLLTAIMATSMFTVALSSKRGSGRGLRKLVADQSARQLSEQLKNYVTGDWSANTVSGVISGPGKDANAWSMTDTTNTVYNPKGIVDDCANTTYVPPTLPTLTGTCYAFQKGSHTITGLMPQWFEGTPYFARIQYWVDPNSYSVAAGSTPQVSVTVQWQETQ